jgi:hypothetical protein
MDSTGPHELGRTWRNSSREACTPRWRDDSTKVRALTRSTSERMRRANVATEAMPTAMAALTDPKPSATTIIIDSRRPGIESSTSTMRLITASTPRPKYAATSPSRAPIPRPMETAMAEARSVRLVPCMTREKRSRPR